MGEYYHPYLVFIQDFFSESLVVGALTLTFFFIGFIKKVLRNADIVDFVFIPYALAILFFPAYQGFRYLLPVFPLIIIYIFMGLQSVDLKIYSKRKYILPIVFSLLVVLFYYQGIEKVFKSKGYTKAGPQTDYSSEVFNYIQNKTSKDAVFAFTKPRVMALYTSRKSIGIGIDKSLEEVDQKFSEVGVDFIVTTSDLNNQLLEDYIKYFNSKLELIWENSRVKVYKMLDKH